MTKLPTDLKILDTIFEKYYEAFVTTPTEERSAFISIDVAEVSADLGVDPDIIFGRLYHYLDKKHSADDSRLFALKAGTKTNAVNFPMLSSILADLRHHNRTENTSLVLSIVSIVISLLSFITALYLRK